MLIALPDDVARQQFGEAPAGVELLVWDGYGDPPPRAREIEFFVGSYHRPPPPRAVFDRLAQLRVIQLSSAGVETWLDRVPDGVRLCNGRGVHGASTAELAVAGLLSVLRRMPELARAQAAHEWRKLASDSLADQRVLVLGAGDIGARVAAATRAFDADTTLVASRARDGVHSVDELPALLPEARAVVIAVPLTDRTRRLVDAGFLAALPSGAIVVNVARGPIIDTSALLAELRSERLRAFLDVTDPEPLPPDHPLWEAPNVVLTPHVAGGTRGWERRAYRLVREQVERYLAREPLANVAPDGR